MLEARLFFIVIVVGGGGGVFFLFCVLCFARSRATQKQSAREERWFDRVSNAGAGAAASHKVTRGDGVVGRQSTNHVAFLLVGRGASSRRGSFVYTGNGEAGAVATHHFCCASLKGLREERTGRFDWSSRQR